MREKLLENTVGTSYAGHQHLGVVVNDVVAFNRDKFAISIAKTFKFRAGQLSLI